jgi:hypothetical protein
MFNIKNFIKKSFGGYVPSVQQTSQYVNISNNLFGIKYNDNLLINDKIINETERYNIAKNHTIVSKAFDIILNHISNVDIVLKQKVGNNINIITKSPVIDLLNNPNGLYCQTEIDFIKKLCFEFMVNGEYYIFYDENNDILEIIESTKIQPINYRVIDNFVTEYTLNYYATDSGLSQINFKYNAIENYYESAQGYKLFVFQDIENSQNDKQFKKSKLSQNIHFISIYENVQNALFSITSKAINNSVLTINHKNDNMVINTEVIQDLKKQLANQINNTSYSGGISLLENTNADFGVEQLNKLQYDQFQLMLDHIETKLMLGLGIPLKMIEASKDVNSSGVMLNITNMQLYKEQILPMLNKILQHLGRFLFNIFDMDNKSYFFDVDLSSIQEFKQYEADIATNLFKENIITRNEARAKIGLPPLLENGDDFANSNQQNNLLLSNNE